MKNHIYKQPYKKKMIRRLLNMLLAAALLLGLSACAGFKPKEAEGTKPVTAPAYKDPAPESVVYSETFGYIPINQIVVVFEDSASSSSVNTALEQIGGTVVGVLDIISLYQIETDFQTEIELTAAMDAARALPGVELVFPNTALFLSDVEGTACTPLNDPVFENENNASHYRQIGMENAWRILKGSGVPLNQVSVGVLDSAIYTGSDEFAGGIKVTGDTTDRAKTEDGVIVDAGLNHGTKVTHVIGADSENGGVSGIASALGDKLEISVKNLFDDLPNIARAAAGEEEIIQGQVCGITHSIKALAYMKEQVDSGATVINCSFGSKEPDRFNEWQSEAYKKFFEYMQEKHPEVVFVAAAGNEGEMDKSKGGLNGKNYYPGGLALPNVITVGALNDDGSRAEFSNFAEEGGEVTLSAPGVEMVVGVDEDGQPIKANGTSFSTPQVTAAVALLQSINPKLRAGDIKKLLTETAAPGITNYAEPGKISPTDTSIPIPEGMGAGVLRVDEAVLRAINDLRAEEGQPPYSLEQALNLGIVSLRASGDGKDFVVTAGIPAALSGSAQVKIDVIGDYIMSGSSTQAVQAGGSAEWGISLEGSSVFLRVTRLDNNACATMTLSEPAPITARELAGSYSGSGVLRHAGEDVEGPASIPVTLYLREDGGGTVDVDGYGGAAEYGEGSVTFSVYVEAEEEDEEDVISISGSIIFEGTPSRSNGNIVISGTMTFRAMGYLLASYSVTLQK